MSINRFSNSIILSRKFSTVFHNGMVTEVRWQFKKQNIRLRRVRFPVAIMKRTESQNAWQQPHIIICGRW